MDTSKEVLKMKHLLENHQKYLEQLYNQNKKVFNKIFIIIILIIYSYNNS